MRSAFDCLYRLRLLLEDTSRRELEMCLKELAGIEKKMQCLEEMQREGIRQIFEGIAKLGPSSWSETMTGMRLASSQKAALMGALQGKQIEVARAKAIYLERRKERLQAESVMEARRLRVELECDRREQRAIDDWFNQQNRLKKTR